MRSFMRRSMARRSRFFSAARELLSLRPMMTERNLGDVDVNTGFWRHFADDNSELESDDDTARLRESDSERAKSAKSRWNKS